MEPKVELNPLALKTHNLEELTANANMPKIYANGFQSQLTLSDANIILVQNNVPVAVVVMTMAAVKSLRNQLDGLMSKYTENIGEEILSFEDLLAQAMEKAKAKGIENK